MVSPRAARADECGDLAGDLARSRAAIEAATGDPSKSPNDLADLMSKNTAITQKLIASCRSQYDSDSQSVWERQQQARADAANTCKQLRAAVPNGEAKNIEKTGAQSALADIQRSALISSAGRCIQQLSPFSSTLNPHLTACLAECRQKQAQYSKPRTPECTAGIQKASAVLDEMQTFLDGATQGREAHVMIDFNVIRERYARESVDAAQKCERGTLPDLETRFAIANAKAAALDNYNEAKDAVAKKLNATMIATHSTNCMRSMSKLPARDTRLETLFGECRAWNQQAKTPPPSAPQAKSSGKKR